MVTIIFCYINKAYTLLIVPYVYENFILEGNMNKTKSKIIVFKKSCSYCK